VKICTILVVHMIRLLSSNLHSKAAKREIGNQ